MIDKPGGTYWKTWDKMLREHLLRSRLISAEDLGLYTIAETVDDAVKCITRFYRNFHSTRFVKELLVIRLQRAPSPGTLAALNSDFADIIEGQPFTVVNALPDELEDNDVPQLARVAFGFDRRQYGRLRQLIDALNGF